MAISKTEKWILIIAAAALWAALSLLAAGPVFSDEMLYIDASLRNLPVPNYGNRYFHIYLQKLFMSVFPTPLAGIRVFWGLLIAGTAALIYCNARLFTEKSTILHGLLAVAFFFSFKLYREYSGEPAVDITAMFMVAVYLSVYLWSLKNPARQREALFILGLLAYLGFKTKETTVFINILLLGYLGDALKHKGWLKTLFNRYLPFAAGALGGVLVFIVLDGLILGKPFFAISPETFGAIFTNYDFEKVFLDAPASWYRVYLLDDIALAFLLFIISGVQLRDKLSDALRLVWVFPLLLVAFITWNMLKVPWGFIERFFFPALPAVAILAAQAVRFEWPRGKKEWLRFGALAAGLLLFGVWMRFVWQGIARDFSFDYARMLDAVYFPIILSVLLAAIIWTKGSGWKQTLIPLFCIATLLFTPLSYNFKYFAVYPKIQERYDLVFYPFIEFGDVIDIREDDQIYISTDVKRGQEMLADDPNDITGMYNFFYDRRIAQENVFIGYDRKKVAADLTTRDFAYALLSAYDVEELSKSAVWDTIQSLYGQILTDENESVYLLIR